jgi:TetR/AcrR family fatty acid metabolism transcriptional regulator
MEGALATRDAKDKRRLILDAAVRVFARSGYHGCRVADIADEAGIAYGLVYHYFSSKEQILQTLFAEAWAEVVAAIGRVRERDPSARVRLRGVAAFLIGSYKRQPDLVRVLIREVARSDQLDRQIAELRQAFDAIEAIVREGQETSELRDDLDPRLVAICFYGAIEEVLTSLTLGELSGADEDVDRARDTLIAMAVDGLARRG